MNKSSLTIALLLLSFSLFAQEDTLKKVDLDEVIVTGYVEPQTLKNSVYQVKVITNDRITKQGAAKLQDVLNNELNFRFSQDLATGGSGIVMNGMAGQNVKILLDGVPLVGRQGVSNEININQIDINTVEKIEIVEGPMSVIYGADALGGVINIITKKPNKAKLSVHAKVHEETVGNEYSLFDEGIHTQSGGLSYHFKNWEIGGNLGYNYFGGWKGDAKGRELTWHKKDQITASAFLGYSKGNFSIRYRLDGLDEIITNPGNFTVKDNFTNDSLAFDQDYLTARLMHQLQSTYKASNKLNFHTQASFSDYSRQVYSTTYSKTSGKVKRNTAPGVNSIDEFTGFTFRMMANYSLNKKVSFQPGVDINLENGKGERLANENNKVNDFAFFLTSEISAIKKLKIRPGLRFIKNSVYDAPPLVPSINVKYGINKMLDFRASYARGFRAPSIRELYYNFFDANHQLVGNPDLKAEISRSWNASLNWKKIVTDKVVYTTVFSGFYNDVENLIFYAPSSTDPNVHVLTNISDSKTSGVQLQSVAKYKRFSIGIGASYVGFYNASSEEDKSLDKMMWSPEANLNIGASFPKIGADLNLFYKFTGKQYSYTYDNTNQKFNKFYFEEFHMTDLTASKKLGKHLTLNVGVRNIFDVTYVSSFISSSSVHSNGGNRNLSTGRSYFANLNFNLNFNKL